MTRSITLGLLILAVPAPAPARPVEVAPFGRTAEGRPARIFTLANKRGMVVRFTDWGGLVTAVEVPDAHGRRDNVALGFGDVATYQARNPGYRFGAPIGRYANRIGGARFAIDGVETRLTPNNGANLLHSGASPGFDQRFWTVAPFNRGRESGAVLTMTSPDGDQGFPGALTVAMTYTLTDRNEFRIDYRATTTRPTVLNLTNHSYFNLAGAGRGDVRRQVVRIDAATRAETDAANLPTGRAVPVAGPFDLRRPRPIGDGIDDPALKPSGGYDVPYILADRPSAKPRRAARVVDPGSGRWLELLTTEPSVQFYTGNGMKGLDRAPDGGGAYVRHGGFALEAEHLPDSPNHPDFPTTVLRPGQVFRATTIYRFGTTGRR